MLTSEIDQEAGIECKSLRSTRRRKIMIPDKGILKK
jgi:hypothetical protein